jgi:hypothetical protein
MPTTPPIDDDALALFMELARVPRSHRDLPFRERERELHARLDLLDALRDFGVSVLSDRRDRVFLPGSAGAVAQRRTIQMQRRLLALVGSGAGRTGT